MRFSTSFFLLAVASLILAGCSGSSISQPENTVAQTELSKANPFGNPDNVKTTTVEEAFKSYKRQTEISFDAFEKPIVSLREIKDDRTANEVIKELQTDTDKVLKSLSNIQKKQSKVFVLRYEDEDAWLSKTRIFNQEQTERVKTNLTRLGNAMANAKAANLSDGCSQRLAVAYSAYVDAQQERFNREAGEDRIKFHYGRNSLAFLVFEGIGSGPKETSILTDEVRRHIKSSSLSAKTRNGVCWIKVAPCDDFHGLVSRIKLGTQEEMDRDNRIVKFSVKDSELRAIEKEAGKRRQKNLDAVLKKQQEAEREIEGQIIEHANQQIREEEKFLENIVQQLKLITIPAVVETVSEKISETLDEANFNDVESIDGIGNPALSQETADKLREKRDASIKQLRAQIESELTRIGEDAELRKAFAKHVGKSMTAQQLLDWDGDAPEIQSHTDSNDPDYVLSNLELLTSGGHFEAKDALARLANVPPKSVDAATRKKVAVALRELALSGDSNEPDDVVKALTNWAGKYSVPILIEMLQTERSRFDKDAMFRALGDYPTKEGADAVAGYAGDFFNGKKALNSLRKMGGVAEDALIRIAPSDSFEVSQFAIIQLGKVGTKKSLKILRQAMKSRNSVIKQAAKDAMAAVRAREEE